MLHRLNPAIEGATIELPQPGTVTLVTGSEAFIAPIELLRELNEHGIQPGELTPLIAAIEEYEGLAAMAVMSTTKTGLSNVV
jgi:hypothetical protein